MKNVTISLDESTLERARRFASQNGFSFNELVRKLIHEAVEPKDSDWLQEMFDAADAGGWGSTGPWKREDAYDEKRIR